MDYNPRALNPFRALYRRALKAALRTAEACGLNVARSRDYYSPLPLRADLERHAGRWNRPSELVGVDVDLAAMRNRLAGLVASRAEEISALPDFQAAKKMGYGPGFTQVDALVLYLMLRQLQPRRFVEIGSGLSTYYAHLAGAANGRDGVACALTCIDPYARPAVAALAAVEIVKRPVQDVEPEFFAALGAGDVLFIDSTHVVKLDGDVPHLYLEVVPRLAPGVIVHSHDVHFPYHVPYPAEEYVFAAKWPSFWTEAMLLQAFLAFNREFEILLSVPLLRFHDEALLAATLPGYRPVEPADYDTHAGSLWFRRRPAAHPPPAS
jgi:predicted O-methyltransferase YrrM